MTCSAQEQGGLGVQWDRPEGSRGKRDGPLPSTVGKGPDGAQVPDKREGDRALGVAAAGWGRGGGGGLALRELAPGSGGCDWPHPAMVAGAAITEVH